MGAEFPDISGASRTVVGVMTLLDGPLRDEALRLWRVFEVEYGSVGVQSFAHPNVTFGGGRTGDVGALAAGVRDLVAQLEPFELSVDGIGHFSEPRPAVYLQVVPSEPLAAVHRAVDEVLAYHCDEVFDLYRPAAWTPHITVGMEDLSQEAFGRARCELSGYREQFVQIAREICLVQATPAGAGYEIARRWPIGHPDRRPDPT